MARKSKTEARIPDYKLKPSAISITIYDLQGSPLPDQVEKIITTFVEAYVKDYGNNSLAINVAKE